MPLIWRDKHPKKNKPALHVHSHVAFIIIGLLSLSLFFFSMTVSITYDAINESLALTELTAKALEPKWSLKDFKSVDVMKWTKDTLNNQPGDAEIEQIVVALKDGLKPTHLAISVPLDSSADYPPGKKPSPRSGLEFTRAWARAIHGQGLKIIWRGTFSGIEGIYNFPKKVGASRVPSGTAATALSDGSASWLGKINEYITTNPDLFQDGDVWAVLPERTENIFQDKNSFLPYSFPGIQQNYAKFFQDLKIISDSAFAQIGKKVITGMTANNYSELRSGWMPVQLIKTNGIIAVDHYGRSHTPEEMEADLRHISKQYGRQVFLQEWGDYWNINLDQSRRLAYLKSMYAVFQKLANERILAGFNYWGGWTGNGEGILVKTPTGYLLNERGKLLAEFFAANP